MDRSNLVQEQVVPLVAGIEQSVARVGQKAAGLGRLLAGGYAVPAGFCVSTAAYAEHLASAALREQVAAVRAALAEGGDSACGARLAALHSAILAAPIAESLVAQVRGALAGLADGPVAVRSSSLAEDRADRASAGLYLTRLGVNGLDPCLQAIRECWASVWSESAVVYRERHGVDHDDAAMAVVVQELVPAQVAGVVFGADPVRGDRHTLIVEASYGLGELLVSGRVAPDRWELARRDLTVRRASIGDKRTALLVDADGVAVQVPVAEERAARAALDADTVQELARIALQLEERLGAPQDIEWAQVDGALHLLQTRPITTLGIRPPGDDLVWSNLNSGEVLPDVMSPLCWSLLQEVVLVIQRIFARLGIDISASPLADRVDGRAYFNLSTLASVLKRTPFGSRVDLTRAFGGMQATVIERLLALPAERLPPVRSGWLRVLGHLPGFLWWALRHHPGGAQGFLDGLAATRRQRETREFAGLDDRELVAEVLDIFDNLFVSDSGLAFMSGGMSDYVLLDIMCRRWLGDENSRITNGLLTAQGGVASADAGMALWRLAQEAQQRPSVARVLADGSSFEEARGKLEADDAGRQFLACWHGFMCEHGHHCRAEVELSNARWSERPDYVLDLLRSYLESMRSIDPLTEYAARAERAIALTEECRGKLGPLRRRLFSKVLKQARRAAAARENVKSELVRHFAQVRVRLLELGRRAVARGDLDSADDVFFFERSELPALAADTGSDTDTVTDTVTGLPAEMRELIHSRQVLHRRHRALNPPPVVGPPELVDDDDSADSADSEADPSVLRGLAVSPGVVTGRVRIILDADGDARVRAGEILVAPYTDPGWTVHFIPAAGLVVDMGGLLSHGSIAAREFGIPAVVNVGPATRTLRDGQLLCVDGDRGEVRILEDEGIAGGDGVAEGDGVATTDAL